MCDPLSLTMISTAATIGGTALGAVGKIKEGQAQAREAEYNSALSLENAKLANIRAKDAIVRGQIEESRVKTEGTLTAKQQQNRFATANIDATYGSPIDMILSTARAYEIDAATVRTNAAREAEDYDQQAANYRADAKMGKYRAQGARSGAALSAAGTVLTGMSTVSNTWANIV